MSLQFVMNENKNICYIRINILRIHNLVVIFNIWSWKLLTKLFVFSCLPKNWLYINGYKQPTYTTPWKIDEINVVKCEPWNSVKITFDLPTEAAQRLSELAELARRGDDTTLRQLGILSLQLQGGQVIKE